ERADDRDIAVLGGEVERGEPVAVVGATEGAAPARGRAEHDEPLDVGDAPGRRGPGERGAPVDVGVDAGAARDEDVERVDAVAAGRPRERLVERLLPAAAGLPGGEAAVRAVEAAVRPGLGAERAVGAHEVVNDVLAPEPGGDPEDVVDDL